MEINQKPLSKSFNRLVMCRNCLVDDIPLSFGRYIKGKFVCNDCNEYCNINIEAI